MKTSNFLSVSIIVTLCFLFSGLTTLANDNPGYHYNFQQMKMDRGQDYHNLHKLAGLRTGSMRTSNNSSKSSNYSEAIDHGVEVKMIWIPAGAMWMRMSKSNPSFSDDKPFYQIQLNRSCYIQETEISAKKWRDIIGKKVLKFENIKEPIQGVTWFDAIIFCNKLSLEKGLKPCYYSDANFSQIFDTSAAFLAKHVFWLESANGYRLPTEAEWGVASQIPSESFTNNLRPESTQTEITKIPTQLDLMMYRSDTDGSVEPTPSSLLTTNASIDNHDSSIGFRIARFAE